MKRADGNATAPSPRRVTMGAIGLSLVVFGVVLGFLWTDCLGTPRSGGWECQGQGFSFALLGGPALVAGVPLVLAAVVRGGTFWRVAPGSVLAVAGVMTVSAWIGGSSSEMESEVSVPLEWTLGAPRIVLYWRRLEIWRPAASSRGWVLNLGG